MVIKKCVVLFFSSRRRHTRCALVTGVQTCALPIFLTVRGPPPNPDSAAASVSRWRYRRRAVSHIRPAGPRRRGRRRNSWRRGGRDKSPKRPRSAASRNGRLASQDRKSVVQGERVCVRVYHGGRSLLKKTNRTY